MLDRDVRAFLAEVGDDCNPGELAVAEIRAEMRAEARYAGPSPHVACVVATDVATRAGGVPVRIYHPNAATPQAAIMWLHGGGWVAGDLNTTDDIARRLCAEARLVVVSVGYRLAPEHRYPAALQDCEDVFAYVSSGPAEVGIDGLAFGVGGDSAGGNLAAGMALARRDGGKTLPAFSLLVYPILQIGKRTESRQQFERGYWYSLAELDWSCKQYLPGDELAEYASPGAVQSLDGMPPTLLYTAEYDILRTECQEYADRLASAGVKTHLVVCRGQIHGFIGLTARLAGATCFFEDLGVRLERLLVDASRSSDASDYVRAELICEAGNA